MRNPLSLILLPTLKCNADCEYCFEQKTNDYLTLDQLSSLMDKVLDYMEESDINALTIYWQGGEIMTLSPQWFDSAFNSIREAAKSRGRWVQHSLQSNMIGYSSKWNPIISKMFGNSVGTSMDFPNRYRKLLNGSAEDYDALWAKNVSAARQAGIEVTAIAVPNAETVKVGAERFYQHFVEQLGITDFQVNTPFPGGEPNETKENLSLDTDQLSQFYVELAQIWLQYGYRNNVRIGPFDALLDYFTEGAACLPCIWQQNCADEFICIDAKGAVAQCDCWVTSYPEYWFGNLFQADSLGELLQTSQARKRFQARPKQLMQQGDCIDCEYLALCHGGCPVRTYTLRNTLTEKDPYCELYQTLFQYMEKGSRQISSVRY